MKKITKNICFQKKEEMGKWEQNKNLFDKKRQNYVFFSRRQNYVGTNSLGQWASSGRTRVGFLSPPARRVSRLLNPSIS